MNPYQLFCFGLDGHLRDGREDDHRGYLKCYNANMNLLFRWLIAAVAILISAYVLPGIKVDGLVPALVLVVILALINAIIKPILILLTLPVNILTLGLFTLVINGLLILLAAAIVPGFHVNGFWWAVLFSIVLSLVNGLLGTSKR